LMTVKMAVAPPIPIASVATAVITYAGDRRSERRA